MTSPRCRKGVDRYGFDKKRTHAACNVVYLDRHRVIVVPAPQYDGCPRFVRFRHLALEKPRYGLDLGLASK